ncbi:RNA-directed DNA polymerase from transposon x-element-like protein-related [Anaeramoeba flamelloides]|uniref:RNA-directed DNA polymerase from transposon x-element-like protein-related n=1 Tax=Anaeramoeba flamelloides TaxID=1746091 RepID=A0ABQ8X5I6_9EUKA|nr:RNA-directed DNA polymerase from transposon x-element-like protein-related [Anaeramoeba flamelloides]
MFFIHKAGDEGIPLNYRPISINNTLARFFLKLIYKGIEESWNLVSDSQFGFKKKLDTRIAVLNLVFELEKLKNDYKNKEFFVVTIDIKKCFDTISHILVHYALDKYIRNEKIKIWLKNYYKKVGLGVYQGDPLSPLLFGFISHFLIEKIKHLAKHVQMFADDLILIMEGPISEIDKKLILIFKIIQEFGMNPNTEKTLKSKTLSEIKYLGIWLEKEKHLKKNFEKKKDENINWEIENLKLLNVELNDFRQKLIINSSGWKGQEYLKIINYNNNINKQQKYLKWEIIEDIDHFLWDCPFYGKNRKIWINELIQINKNNKQLKNNILDIIRNKDSLFILSLVNDKENYDSLLKFLNKNLEIRAVRGN